MPFADREATAAYMIGTVIRTVVFNTNFVKEGEITSYRDLLKAQYKGKIALNDPSVTGAGFSAMVHLGQNLWGEADTLDFLRRLIQEQGASIHRDNNAHVDSVARGKYAIGLGPAPELLDKFMDAHAPLKIAMVKEDNRVTQAAGGCRPSRAGTRPPGRREAISSTARPPDRTAPVEGSRTWSSAWSGCPAATSRTSGRASAAAACSASSSRRSARSHRRSRAANALQIPQSRSKRTRRRSVTRPTVPAIRSRLPDDELEAVGQRGPGGGQRGIEVGALRPDELE